MKFGDRIGSKTGNRWSLDGIENRDGTEDEGGKDNRFGIVDGDRIGWRLDLIVDGSGMGMEFGL